MQMLEENLQQENGHTGSKGMPHPLQLALCGREFSGRDRVLFAAAGDATHDLCEAGVEHRWQ